MKRYMLSYRADAHSVRFAKFQEDNKGAHLVKHADIHLKGTYVEAGHINAVPSCDTAMIPAIPMQQTPPYLQVTLALYGGACLPAAAVDPESFSSAAPPAFTAAVRPQASLPLHAEPHAQSRPAA